MPYRLRFGEQDYVRSVALAEDHDTLWLPADKPSAISGPTVLLHNGQAVTLDETNLGLSAIEGNRPTRVEQVFVATWLDNKLLLKGSNECYIQERGSKADVSSQAAGQGCQFEIDGQSPHWSLKSQSGTSLNVKDGEILFTSDQFAFTFLIQRHELTVLDTDVPLTTADLEVKVGRPLQQHELEKLFYAADKGYLNEAILDFKKSTGRDR